MPVYAATGKKIVATKKASISKRKKTLKKKNKISVIVHSTSKAGVSTTKKVTVKKETMKKAATKTASTTKKTTSKKKSTKKTGSVTVTTETTVVTTVKTSTKKKSKIKTIETTIVTTVKTTRITTSSPATGTGTILFNTILEEYGEEKADGAVRKMNRSFSHPLSEKSLKSYLSTSRKKGYKFSNQTIINYLCITKEEQDMLHFHPSSKREEEREKKRQVKRERVQLVIELAKEGRSQREIAKMSGTSQSTVCRILRDPDKALAPRKTTANKTEENQTRKKESDSKQKRNDETEKSAEKVNGEKEDKAKQKNLPCEKQVENDNTNGYENSPMINERKATDYSVVDEQDAGG